MGGGSHRARHQGGKQQLARVALLVIQTKLNGKIGTSKTMQSKLPQQNTTNYSGIFQFKFFKICVMHVLSPILSGKSCIFITFDLFLLTPKIKVKVGTVYPSIIEEL